MTQEQYDALQCVLLEAIFGKSNKDELRKAVTIVQDMLLDAEIKKEEK